MALRARGKSLRENMREIFGLDARAVVGDLDLHAARSLSANFHRDLFRQIFVSVARVLGVVEQVENNL